MSVEDSGGASPSAADEFVAAATFLFADEAEVACPLIRSCGIVCYLANEHMLAKVWPWNIALGGLRLMVPDSLLEQVHEILNERLSEEDLLSQAGFDSPIESTGANPSRAFNRGRSGGRVRAWLAIAVLCAPAVDALRVLYVAP